MPHDKFSCYFIWTSIQNPWYFWCPHTPRFSMREWVPENSTCFFYSYFITAAFPFFPSPDERWPQDSGKSSQSKRWNKNHPTHHLITQVWMCLSLQDCILRGRKGKCKWLGWSEKQNGVWAWLQRIWINRDGTRTAFEVVVRVVRKELWGFLRGKSGWSTSSGSVRCNTYGVSQAGLGEPCQSGEAI